MSAILIALGVALAAQVTGGGRYSTPPANNPDTEFGNLLAEEPATAPAGGATPGSASLSEVENDPHASAGSQPSVTPKQPANTPLPTTAPYQPPQRSGLNRGVPPASTYRNNSVPPVSAPPGDVRPETEPAELLQAILAKPTGSKLGGAPVALQEVVQGAGSREEQTARIDAYWDLCCTVANYHLALAEVQELAHLQQRQPALSAALRSVETITQSRVATAERAARVAQLHLARLMNRPAISDLPLAKDRPHCGAYLTKYEDKFGSDGPPEAAELHVLLPLQFAEMEAAAEAVERCEQRLESITNGGADAATIQQAFELLALQRRAFVQLVRAYNGSITRYTEIATPGRLATGRLVAMLIRTDRAPAVAQRTGETKSAPPRNEAPPGRAVPQTFFTPADRPARGSAIQPLSGEFSPTPAEEPDMVPPSGNDYVLPLEN